MKLLKEFGQAFFIGVLIFMIMMLVKYFSGEYTFNVRELLIDFGYNQLYAVALYMANAMLFYRLIGKYKSDVFKPRNLLKAVVGGVLITLCTIFLLRLFTEMFVYGDSYNEFIADERFDYYYVSLIISVVVTSIFYLVYYYRHRQEKQVKEQKIIARTASAQFDALKNQLDPHFLFNSLNVLTSLIEENPAAATKFTTSLSKVYRYVLEQKNKELVTLEEELNFAELYMSLIKMRFEDSIVFETPKSISNPEAKVVPLSLQLLLENAVKHNQVTPAKKLHIQISEENGNLLVKNNIQPKKVVKKSSGVGLENIRQRYYLLTDRPVIIEEALGEFKVSVPLLTKSTTTVMQTQDNYLSAKKYDRAKKQVEELKGFYIHLVIYTIMVPVFIYLNIISTDFPWALFPIVGWGVGVIGHAMEVFNYNPILGKNWEERKIRELMDKDDH